MLSFIKVIFFVVAGIFLVSYLQETDFSVSSGSSNTYDSSGTTERAAYTRSYDRNNDGAVSDSEYQKGELARIEDEIELLEEEVALALEDANASPFRDKVSLRGGNIYAEGDEEYVTLYASIGDNETINITGWKLKSLLTKRSVTLGEGVQYLTSGRPWFGEDDIYLADGDTAYVSTGGAAAIRTSFLTNKCTGYLDTNYRFTPSLPRDCPLLRDEDLDSFDLSFNDFRREREYDECMDAIENVYMCERGTTNHDLTDDCRDFIRNYSTYDGCVKLHKNDPDYLGDEWHIFLNASRDDLWRSEREAIGLYDRNGKVVDVIRY